MDLVQEIGKIVKQNEFHYKKLLTLLAIPLANKVRSF